MAGDEEVVVVEDEDVDAARPLQRGHLVGDGVELAQAVALAGQALLVPGRDAAEGAVGVAAAARDQRRDGVAEARRRLAAPVGPGERGELGQPRLGREEGRAVRVAQARARRRRRARRLPRGRAPGETIVSSASWRTTEETSGKSREDLPAAKVAKWPPTVTCPA